VLQPAKPAAVAAMARLSRVFFTIHVPVYEFLWLSDSPEEVRTSTKIT
jgi:hypothetical protein